MLLALGRNTGGGTGTAAVTVENEASAGCGLDVLFRLEKMLSISRLVAALTGMPCIFYLAHIISDGVQLFF